MPIAEQIEKANAADFANILEPLIRRLVREEVDAFLTSQSVFLPFVPTHRFMMTC